MSSSANDALNDELEALTSIYDSPILTIQPSNSSSSKSSDSPASIPAILALPNDVGYTFNIIFPLNYPDVPPQIVGTHHVDASVKKGQGDVATTILRDVLARIYTPGQVCLFDLVEEATPLLLTATQQLDEPVESDGADHGRGSDSHTTTTDAGASAFTTLSESRHATTAGAELEFESEPRWILSEPLIVNKSTFIARCLRVSSLREAQDSIAYLISTNKRVAAATHNITAWRIRQAQTQRSGTSGNAPAAEITIQDCDDDGETAAGGRLLHLLQLMDVWNVLVVVTRWYGGVKLGPDRFRCINAVARDALLNAGFTGVEKKKSKK